MLLHIARCSGVFHQSPVHVARRSRIVYMTKGIISTQTLLFVRWCRACSALQIILVGYCARTKPGSSVNTPRRRALSLELKPSTSLHTADKTQRSGRAERPNPREMFMLKFVCIQSPSQARPIKALFTQTIDIEVQKASIAAKFRNRRCGDGLPCRTAAVSSPFGSCSCVTMTLPTDNGSKTTAFGALFATISYRKGPR